MSHFLQHIDSKDNRIVSIFSKYYSDLVYYGSQINNNKSLVEDCIQDLFLKFCENSNLILDANDQEAYLKTSLKRQILKRVELHNNQKKMGSKMIEISEPSYEEVLIKNQSSIQDSLFVKSLLDELSPSQKTILTMRFYRSMSYEEIATKLVITKRTVYNQVHDSLKKLKSIQKKN